MNRLDRWLIIGLVLTLGFFLGMLGFGIWDKMPSTVERVNWSNEAQWIGPQVPSYRFYLRRTFNVADTVQAAWLRLSADDDFILYANGHRIAKQGQVLYNSFGLASRRSELWQGFNDSVRYQTTGYDGIHISNPRDWILTTYIDLSNYLRPGKNTIALEIQKSRKNPRVVVEGTVYPVQNASPINLTTGATPWKVSNLYETRQKLQWFEPDFPDESWSEAKTIGSVKEVTYSRLSKQIFDRTLQGNWISGNESSQGEVWLRGDWLLSAKPQRAFIRFAGDGQYSLLINGLLIKRYGTNELHSYEVTNCLKTGHNFLAVRLARSLDTDWSRTQNDGSVSQNDSLGFFLDGWVETSKNTITAPIATDSNWVALRQPIPGWADGSGQGQPATILRMPQAQEFQRQFKGNAYLLNYPDSLWHESIWYLGGIGCAFICAWGLGWFCLGRQSGWWDSFATGTGLLLPGILFLIGVGLLKHRYAEAEPGFLFVQPQSNSLILSIFLGIALLSTLGSQIQRFQAGHSFSLKTLPLWGLFGLGAIGFVSWSLIIKIAFPWSVPIMLVFLLLNFAVLTLVGRRFYKHIQEWVTAIIRTSPAWGKWVLLVLIIGIGFALRTYNLGLMGPEADENTSYDAIRGILRTGAPEASSGIWYTRSPAYHYMAALWLRLVGDSLIHGRFFSALWGTATLVLVFILSRKITGNFWFAIFVTAILAIDPREIYYSRLLRFYQVLQFMGILAFWSFLKGFIERSGRFYQYIFFIAITLAVLNQEVTLILLPCFLIGFLFFYRPFSLKFDWQIVVGSLISLGIIIYDLLFFSIKCLTPLVALSDSTDSYIKPRLLDISAFANAFFAGQDRTNTLYSFFFFLGLLYFIKRRDKIMVFLFSSVILNIVLILILVYHVSVRYAYNIYPLFIILSIYSAICIGESLGNKLELLSKKILPLKKIGLIFIILLMLANIEPHRVLSGYQDAINRRNDDVFQYIRDHREPGDVVVSPTSPGAGVILGHLDYYLAGTLKFDVPYWRDGRMIDRWAGGVIISNLDQISDILQKHNRVWIHLDDSQENNESRFTSETLQYLRTLGQPVFESFGTRLRLWQRGDGIFPRVPNEGKDLGNY